ncbi:MAG: hypothetical protein Q4A00_03450 [Flavobacteriaceae bacterium]|nr:hypothetical protein [Flavobacteriaceae bacterium]
MTTILSTKNKTLNLIGQIAFLTLLEIFLWRVYFHFWEGKEPILIMINPLILVIRAIYYHSEIKKSNDLINIKENIKTVINAVKFTNYFTIAVVSFSKFKDIYIPIKQLYVGNISVAHFSELFLSSLVFILGVYFIYRMTYWKITKKLSENVV